MIKNIHKDFQMNATLLDELLDYKQEDNESLLNHCW